MRARRACPGDDTAAARGALPGNVTRTSPATLSALAQTVCRGLRDGDSPDEAGVLLTSYVGAAPFDESPQTAQAVAATAKIFCPNVS